MNEQNYSKRELDSKFLNIEDKMDAHFETNGIMLSEIKKQTTKTNGRVNWLEKLAYISMGALPLLTIWAGWLTKIELDSLKRPADIPAIQAAVNQAFDDKLNVP